MKRALLAIALLLLGPGSASASDLEREIAHLLTAVSESPCIFVRNGSEHSARNAREHMELKYGRIRRRVKTAEQFIQYAGTESSISGKAYSMRCQGVESPTGEWLTAELARYRAQQPGAGKAQ